MAGEVLRGGFEGVIPDQPARPPIVNRGTIVIRNIVLRASGVTCLANCNAFAAWAQEYDLTCIRYGKGRPLTTREDFLRDAALYKVLILEGVDVPPEWNVRFESSEK